MKRFVFLLLAFVSLCLITSCSSEPLSVEKHATCASDRTVHPGDTITYEFSVTNPNKRTKQITITDTVPQYTAFQGGDTLSKNGKLEFKVSVPPKSTKRVSYTVEVSEDEECIGLPIISDGAKADGEPLSCETLYVGRTLNAIDQEKFSMAIHAMLDSKMKSTELFNFLYYIAYSKKPPINEEPAEVMRKLFLEKNGDNIKAYSSMLVPGLYGGKCVSSIKNQYFVGDPTESITLADLMPGDLLFVLPSKADSSSARVYCTDRYYLYDLTDSCGRVGDSLAAAALTDADYFAVLRPVAQMQSFYRSEPLAEGATAVEKAIIATAESFLLRGDRMQYADIRLVTSQQNYRWERGKAPEDYTTDETGYTNCTGFVHDVYFHALGFDYGDFPLKNAPREMKAFVYYFSGNETNDQKTVLEEEYLASLQVGDIIFYSYSSNNHAMLYVGNGNLIHATGSTHNGYVEKEEPSIRFDRVETLFDPASSRYVFSKEKPRTALYIIRPLNSWRGSSIPTTSEKRIGEMRRIMAEKTCSATLGETANPGDVLTYTFTLYNTNPQEVKLNITDRIPENTVLLLNGATSEQTDFSWTVDLAPQEKRTLSYQVKILESVAMGTAIICTDDSKVGGISVKATPVFIGRTLTESEQEKIRESAGARISMQMDPIDLLNEIYRDALGVEKVIDTSLENLQNVVFPVNGDLRQIAGEGYYAAMIAPSQYGGRKVIDSERFLGERTRLTRERNLIVGDILYLQGTSTYGLYIYLGNGELLNLTNGLARMDIGERLGVTLGWPMFAVLRLSLAFNS